MRARSPLKLATTPIVAMGSRFCCVCVRFSTPKPAVDFHDVVLVEANSPRRCSHDTPARWCARRVESPGSTDC